VSLPEVLAVVDFWYAWRARFDLGTCDWIVLPALALPVTKILSTVIIDWSYVVGPVITTNQNVVNHTQLAIINHARVIHAGRKQMLSSLCGFCKRVASLDAALRLEPFVWTRIRPRFFTTFDRVVLGVLNS